MKVGFTGTRRGMSEEQRKFFRDLILHLDPAEFHHGDCVGADNEAHWIVVGLRAESRLPTEDPPVKIVQHPPKNPTSRACTPCDEVRPELDYLDRNKKIVDETDLLIAAPGGPERQRSGTWSTIRYALRAGKTTIIMAR